MLMDILRALAKVNGSRYASFTYTKVPRISEKTGNVVGELLTPETSRHVILLGADKKRLYADDIVTLTPMLATLTGLPLQAAQELHASRAISLESWEDGESNPAYTLADTLIPFDGVPGVSVNVNDGTLLFTGLSQSKTIIGEAATYKSVISKALTVEKDKIRRVLPSSRLRSFRLDGVERAAIAGKVYVQNNTLVIEN
jgi:hypothetical protein